MALYNRVMLISWFVIFLQLFSISSQSGIVCTLFDLTPETVIEEILSRLPIQDRLRFRSTCNYFCELISVHEFSEEDQKFLLSLISVEDAARIGIFKHYLFVPGYYQLDFCDSEDRGLLYWAIFLHGSLELVNFLFQKGASLTNPRNMKKILDCIMYCKNGESILSFLIENGCLLGVHGQWNFFSLVVLMAKGRFFEIFKENDKITDWINAIDSAGRTPLFSARRYNVAVSLLDHGANATVRDIDGNTASQNLRRDLRSSAGSDLVELLIKAEVKS